MSCGGCGGCPCPGTPQAKLSAGMPLVNRATLRASAWTRLPNMGVPYTIVPTTTVHGVCWIAAGRQGDATSNEALLRTAQPTWSVGITGDYWAYWTGSADVQVAMVPMGYQGTLPMCGIVNQITHSQTVMTGASVSVLSSNIIRRYALIQASPSNAGTIWISLGAAAVTGDGIGLAAGDAYEIEKQSNLWRGSVLAIGAAPDEILVTEGV